MNILEKRMDTNAMDRAQGGIGPVRAWIEAARPKTLPASVSPVLVGCALAWRDGCFSWVPALLCLGVALLAQVASNLANDYFDYKQGADGAGRLGPARAVASGWIAPQAMWRATLLVLALACLMGCGLLFYGGWLLLPVGIAVALCVVAYSAGPFPLAYNGLGDLCVLLFYGVVPVCFTYYVQAGAFSLLSLLLSLAVGLLSVDILVVNNYRDLAQDRAARKRTTVVLFGPAFGRLFYLVNGLLAILLVLPLVLLAAAWKVCLLAAFFCLFLATWRELVHRRGSALNRTLAHTARNVLLFALLLAAILLG